MNNTPKLSGKTHDLINEVAHYFPGDVQVQFIGNAVAGYVRHDQAQVVQDGDNLLIQINDNTEPDFTASHELLHLLMTLRGFSQIYFPLTTGDQALDEQIQYVGTELFDAVAHFVVYNEQRKHGLVTEPVETEFIKGVQHTITPESDRIDSEMLLRLIVVLDAMVFFGPDFAKHKAVFEQNFPLATDAAAKLYQLISAKPTKSPFSMRRNVVKLFRAFDAQMKVWDIPQLYLNDFAMITSVFSKRQLGLQVNQVFKLYYSELKAKNTQKRAYVGFTLTDQQNSFVIEGPAGEKRSKEFFAKVYEKTVKELFDELKIPYLIR